MTLQFSGENPRGDIALGINNIEQDKTTNAKKHSVNDIKT